MLVTALSPVIGYDKASRIAHMANDEGTTLKAAANTSGLVSEERFEERSSIRVRWWAAAPLEPEHRLTD